MTLVHGRNLEGLKWNELSSSVASLGLELDSGVRLSVLVLSVFSRKLLNLLVCRMRLMVVK